MTPQFEDRYTIFENDDRGPLISESRVTVFDVLEMQQTGVGLYEICTIFNLTPLQVQTALAYIADHRPALEAELTEIQQRQRALEVLYRTQAATIEQRIAAQPVSSQRSTFLALRERAENEYTVNPNADSPQ